MIAVSPGKNTRRNVPDAPLRRVADSQLRARLNRSSRSRRHALRPAVAARRRARRSQRVQATSSVVARAASSPNVMLPRIAILLSNVDHGTAVFERGRPIPAGRLNPRIMRSTGAALARHRRHHEPLPTPLNNRRQALPRKYHDQ